MYRFGDTKMSILIVPYDGESPELINALKPYKCTPKKNENACKGGSCPIPRPFRMMSADEVETSIENTLKNVENVKHVSVLALNDSDKCKLVQMSRDWGSKGVSIKIIGV